MSTLQRASPALGSRGVRYGLRPQGGRSGNDPKHKQIIMRVKKCQDLETYKSRVQYSHFIREETDTQRESVGLSKNSHNSVEKIFF